MVVERLRILNAEPRDYSSQARALLLEVADVDDIEVPAGELARYAPAYDMLIVRLRHSIDRSVLLAGDRLKAVATATTGLDHIDLKTAEERGIAVLSLKGEVDFLRTVFATAEHTWALLLAAVRKIPQAAQSVHWYDADRDNFRARELNGKTLGVIGLGRIASQIVNYANAFGMTVVAFDPYVTTWPNNVRRADSLRQLLAQSDYVTVHVPLNSGTRNLIGAAEFSVMKPDAVLVNTSRGEVIDEDALLVALQNRIIAAAALDVITGERQGMRVHPLIEYARQNSNLLITPHLGGNTVDSFEKTEIFMAQKIRAFAHQLLTTHSRA